MAKRKYLPKTTKIQPVPLKLNYVMSADQGIGYIDLAKDCSRLARKFIRQGQLFAIGNVRITMPSASTATAGNSVYVSAMQNTWVVSNAWHKTFAMWNKQQMEAIEDAGAESAVARFRDFKVYLDKQHSVQGNLEPVNMGPFDVAGPFPTAVVTAPSPAAPEQWTYSQIVIPNDGAPGVTTEYTLHMHGADSASTKGMVEGYRLSRSFPQSPAPVAPGVSTGFMSEMFDVGDNLDDITNNAQYNNRELPYDQDAYPGATAANYQFPENKAWCFNRSTVGVNTFNLGGMVAPCGLLRIDQLYSDGSPTDLIIEIELLPGKARGYHTSPMQDM